MLWKILIIPFLAHLLAAPAPVPDKIILRDGRVIDDCKVDTSQQEMYVIFPHGRLPVQPGQVKEILLDSDENYQPRNDYEREQLQKGFVLFEGVWRTKRKRDAILAERRQKHEERMKEISRHLAWENAWRKETTHFVLLTNTSEELLEYYTELFEAFYSTFTKQWDVSGARSLKKKKPVIKIFRNRKQYLASNAPRDSSGLFDARNAELKLYHDPADPRFTLDVLFHEATHLMVYLLRPQFIFPIWVNEGLAEYYGPSILGKDGKIHYGEVQEGRLAVLRYILSQDGYIPLEQMLLSPQNQFGPVHYAEAWALIHFLLEHKKYRSKFLSFFATLVTGTGLEEVVIQSGSGKGRSYINTVDAFSLFKKKMGLKDLTDLEREYLHYLYYGLPEVGPRGYVASARIRIRDDDIEGALEDLESALELGTRDPTCYLYKARIFVRLSNYEEAAVAYMKAIELDALNPDYHLETGRALRGSNDSLMIEEGLRQIYLATELAPHDPWYKRILELTVSGQDLIEFEKSRQKRLMDQMEKEREEEVR